MFFSEAPPLTGMPSGCELRSPPRDSLPGVVLLGFRGDMGCLPSPSFDKVRRQPGLEYLLFMRETGPVFGVVSKSALASALNPTHMMSAPAALFIGAISSGEVPPHSVKLVERFLPPGVTANHFKKAILGARTKEEAVELARKTLKLGVLKEKSKTAFETFIRSVYAEAILVLKNTVRESASEIKRLRGLAPNRLPLLQK